MFSLLSLFNPFNQLSRRSNRCGVMVMMAVVIVMLAALVSGCAQPGFGASDPEPLAPSVRGDDCRGERSRCMYEGPYEKGERQYAEEEARRLNLTELEKLRARQ